MSRILFKINGIEFEDYRFPIKAKEGGGFEVPEFDAAKTTGLLAVNMNRAPILQLKSGVTIGQSKSIERYISRQCKLLGDNDEEEGCIDCLAENVRDIRDKWGKIRMTTGSSEKEEAIKKFYESELQEWLEKLENSLPTQKEGQFFAVGSRLSYADVQIWYLMTEVFDKNELAKGISSLS